MVRPEGLLALRSFFLHNFIYDRHALSYNAFMPYADETTKTKTVAVKLPKPKHWEEYTTRESAAFQPIRAVLQVILEPDGDPVPYELYLRAPNQDAAMWCAYEAFKAWEHPVEYLQDKDKEDSFRQRMDLYPMINTTDDPPSVGYKITEDEWEEALRDAKRLSQQLAGYRLIIAGMPENPNLFRLVRPGWKDVNKQKFGDKNIVMPDDNVIRAVQAQKAFIDSTLKQ